MARQPAWTRETAINYLVDKNLLTKSPEEYTTPYLKRLASSSHKAEQEGREFTREEARGHARAKVEHLEKEGHRLDQYRVEKPPKRDLNMKDLENLLKRTNPKTKGLPDNLKLVIKGLVRDSPTKRGEVTEARVQTFTFDAKWSKINLYVKNHKGTDIFQFALDATGGEWESVESVSFAYAEGLGRHGRGRAA